MADRPYLFWELTNSLCSTCLRKVEAKITLQDGRAYMVKHCPEHKGEKVLLSTDAEYFKLQRGFLKRGQVVREFQTPIRYGCPFDCGICPDHEQHGCVTLVEITDHCNLACPICYSESGPQRPVHRSLEQVEFMLDCAVRNEGEPDVVQISGGEPTVHPQFWEVMAAARRRPIKHLMLNTNGVRIASSDDFARRLAELKPHFEVYLQFDALSEGALRALRGEDLREVRLRALERLNRYDISTTLVVTLMKGVNDGEIGPVIEFALKQDCVRGVTFQPVQAAGRLEGYDPARDRLTLGEVRRQILAQHPLFAPEDIIPVPCHPDCLAMGYALKRPGGAVPLTHLVGRNAWLESEGSTIIYERDPGLREKLFSLFSTAPGPEGRALSLKQLLCCLPLVEVPDEVTYRNVFRVLVVQFLDRYNFDVRSVKRSCIHIVHPDGRVIPFDTFNMFYRDQPLEQQLVKLRSLA